MRTGNESKQFFFAIVITLHSLKLKMNLPKLSNSIILNFQIFFVLFGIMPYENNGKKILCNIFCS